MPALRTRILYIDDDPGLCRLVQKDLERQGYVVEIATDGASGLARIAQGGIDVVALDHYMPNQDGLETLASIRNLAEPPPVIYVTAMQEGRVAVAALKAGAADSRPLQHCGAHQLSPMANPQGIVRFLISRRFLHVHRTIARRER